MNKLPLSAIPLVLVGMFISFDVCADEILTKQILQKMVQEVEKASVSRDVNVVLKYIAPEVRIVTKVKTPSGEQTVPMDYETYKTALVQTWSAAKEYHYKREKLDIKISPDQKEATITAVVRESYVMDGDRMTTVAREVSTVRLVNGRPMIVKINAEQLE